MDKGGSYEDRFNAISSRGQELGLTERQANYVAETFINDDGNMADQRIKRKSGLSATEIKALDAWTSSGGDQYLDRLVGVNKMNAERDALMEKHHLVANDGDAGGMTIVVDHGR